MHHYIIMQKFKTEGNNVIYLWTYIYVIKNLNIQENTHQVQAEEEEWSDYSCVGNTIKKGMKKCNSVFNHGMRTKVYYMIFYTLFI